MHPRPYQLALEEVLSERGHFGHREHLELAWRYLRDGDPQTARLQMSDAIRHVAAAHGKPDRYHHTITLTWLQLVAVHRADRDAPTFEQFIERNPGLLDKHLPARHFSRERLASPEARSGWVEPDLRALPAC